MAASLRRLPNRAARPAGARRHRHRRSTERRRPALAATSAQATSAPRPTLQAASAGCDQRSRHGGRPRRPDHPLRPFLLAQPGDRGGATAATAGGAARALGLPKPARPQPAPMAPASKDSTAADSSLSAGTTPARAPGSGPADAEPAPSGATAANGTGPALPARPSRARRARYREQTATVHPAPAQRGLPARLQPQRDRPLRRPTGASTTTGASSSAAASTATEAATATEPSIAAGAPQGTDRMLAYARPAVPTGPQPAAPGPAAPMTPVLAAPISPTTARPVIYAGAQSGASLIRGGQAGARGDPARHRPGSCRSPARRLLPGQYPPPTRRTGRWSTSSSVWKGSTVNVSLHADGDATRDMLRQNLGQLRAATRQRRA